MGHNNHRMGWDETRDYLDYAAQVGVLILTAHGPWIGDPGIRVARINEWFGEKVNREWTGHAIKQLLAVAVISESWVIPYRYARNPRPVKDIRYRAHYNNGKQGIDISPKNATVPYPQMAHERS